MVLKYIEFSAFCAIWVNRPGDIRYSASKFQTKVRAEIRTTVRIIPWSTIKGISLPAVDFATDLPSKSFFEDSIDE